MAKQRLRKRTKSSPTKAKQIRKIATGIAGLDDVLNGGLPAGHTTLVSGGPGSGKTVLGLEFLYRGALEGEPGIFFTFEERAASVRQNALSLGWDLSPLEKTGKLFLMEGRVDPQALLSGDFDLKGMIGIIDGKARAMGADRIVIDAIDVLLRLFDDPVRERNELYALHDWLVDHEMTTVLTVKGSRDPHTSSRYEFLDFMAGCVIHLDQRVVEQVSTRRLRVIKYRGSGFRRNEHPFAIVEDGIKTVPISSSELQHKAPARKVSSGHPRLDTILDGGYPRASCILISGTPGTGKTTLASTFARSACERGEKVLYVNFEESQEAMLASMLSPGIDLRPALEAGTLRFVCVMPESMGVEEHLIRILQAIESFEADHVVVDAISSCERMGTQQATFELLLRVVTFCKDRGVTTILVKQGTGFTEEHEISGVGISSLVDTVLFLRYSDVGGEINRMLLVMKSRGSKHSNQYREFFITDRGIDIVDVYVGEGGVLTGAARQVQEAREAVEQRRSKWQIEMKKHEVVRRQSALEAQAESLRAELEVAKAELEGLLLEQETGQIDRERRAKMRGEDLDSLRVRKPKGRGKAGRAKEGAK